MVLETAQNNKVEMLARGEKNAPLSSLASDRKAHRFSSLPLSLSLVSGWRQGLRDPLDLNAAAGADAGVLGPLVDAREAEHMSLDKKGTYGEARKREMKRSSCHEWLVSSSTFSPECATSRRTINAK